MFFHVGKQAQQNFPHNHKCGNFVVSLDEGWHLAHDAQGNPLWYKGYLDQGNLADHVVGISMTTIPEHYGNFCIIKVVDRGVVLHTDRLRSFPIWHSAEGLTNLKATDRTVWTNSFVMMSNDMTLTDLTFDLIASVPNSTLSFDQVVDQVDALLTAKTEQFLSQPRPVPLRVFLSGGIDTATVFAYIKRFTTDYELVLGSHVDYDYFYLKNHGTLSRQWGYRQIHHWREDCVLASGAPGDEFTVRNPTTANLLLLHHGTSIPELLSDIAYGASLHRSYYDNPAYMKMWQAQAADYQARSLSQVIHECCSHNINDWQHWHLGRTLTWTPMRDLEMFKLIARLEPRALVTQVMHSTVQKELIRRHAPEVLGYLSTQKNSNNYLENLVPLLDQ
jgi:hypothetical protein